MKYLNYVQEIEKDPDYKEAWESLKPHFNLANAVLRARLKRGWTQTELAQKVGTKQANISRIEAGVANPTLNLIQKIIQTLELEINFSQSSSTTTSTVYSQGQPGIYVSNWPKHEPSNSSNAGTQVKVFGD